ncbi:helix-turn-helix domain-containing protein [Sporohalobacter salinus]|uniref:helix-turn-helix domain-containing protein n=1 Tax=Sporohalobacter salinus TaxID=1494606 RepID=UPI001960B279|nr:helix-turn-helix domain-containing protein [Sporohalobacter salinus]MBM7624919.1 excisionase family DNA binding protein [Sporohalobacter salinus]
MSEDKYTVSVDEAANRLNVSRRTIYRRLNNDKLNGIKKRTKHGDKWFISENEFSDQAEVIQEVVETERKMDINDLKQEIKEVFLETQKEIIKKTISKQREVIKNEIKKETEKLDDTVNDGLNQVKKSVEETVASIPKTIKEEQKEHRHWINQRDRKLMRNIRRMQKKQKREDKKEQGVWHKLIEVFK